MFTHLFFIPFLVITAAIYWILNNRNLRLIFLTVSSYLFIGYFDINAMITVCFLTLYTYAIASLLEKRRVSYVHKIGVVGLVVVLIAFKYLGFLSETINSIMALFNTHITIRLEHLFMPLGLSYIIFKYISYLTDIYWGIGKKGNLLEFACYGSLFTIFIAGPIERFTRFRTTLTNENPALRSGDFSYAFDRFVIGLFEKLVIADTISNYVNPVWLNLSSYSLLIKVTAVLGYSVQIYADFSAYTDMAIASSRLFGLKIMKNFDNPYLAINISQFWRKWHISLSDWIRDYLFFPLSQLYKKKLWLMFCVPIIAMGLCGLWHGAAWHFVLWGIWHGVGLAIYQQWSNIKRNNKKALRLSKSPWFGYISVLITYVFVSTGWIVFGNANIFDLFKLNGNGQFNIKGFMLIWGSVVFIFSSGALKHIYHKHLHNRSALVFKLIILFVLIEILMNLSVSGSQFRYAGF